MNVENLQIGSKVYLLRFKKANNLQGRAAGYHRIGLYLVEEITDKMIRLKRDGVGYRETVNIIDLRQRNYRMQLEDGTEVQFRPMVDVKKIEQIREVKRIEESNGIKRRESEVMAKMTKEDIKEMADRGQSVEQIADYYAASYPAMRMNLLKAKITMLLNGKKPGRAKKVDTAEIVKAVTEGIHTTLVIADEFATSEHEEATSIKEAAEQTMKQVDNTAQESADKIKLSQAVDEMMEMVPDSINHPAHYTAGSIEVIDYLQEKMTPDMFEGFCIGNALKYLSRYKLKGGIEDLKKAQWYLSRIIGVMESA